MPLVFEIVLHVSVALMVYKAPTHGRFVGTAGGPVGWPEGIGPVALHQSQLERGTMQEGSRSLLTQLSMSWLLWE